jgi:hypothetical protein
MVAVLLIAGLAWRLQSGSDDAIATTPIAATGSTATTDPPGSTARPADTTVPPTSSTTEAAPSTTGPRATSTTASVAVPPTNPGPTPPPTEPRPRVARVAVVGDSSAERLAPGIATWGTETGQLVGVGNGSRIGCPMGRGGQMHSAADAIGPVAAACDWATTSAMGMDRTERPAYPDLVDRWQPDVVVVYAGGWDVADRLLPGDTTWRAIGDPVVDAWLLDEMTAATDLLARGGARVVWLTQPPWEGATRHPPERLYPPAADPARMRRYNELLLELAARRPDTVRVIDLAGWLAATGEDGRLRPDGAHFEPATAVEVLRRYLGAELLRSAG